MVPVGRVRLDVTDSWGRWGSVTDQRRKTTPTSHSDLAQKTEVDPASTHQTPLPPSSPPPGPHFRSRRTPGKESRLPKLPERKSARQEKIQSSFTCSQVSRIMTSSVARSSWVSSPGTSSIWREESGGRVVPRELRKALKGFQKAAHLHFRDNIQSESLTLQLGGEGKKCDFHDISVGIRDCTSQPSNLR